ncbi:hypothetical protein [Corynebacterium diphtheriae]|uniref:hypothetical protein n=1 Tax=Corynebacterium diphtheriae TaxID=1717 RepID=UPI000B4AF5B7|nr:hypothetical protein [Corynebacterium diphtheriae]OWN69800.1 hypothetical protein AY501_08370 [Corynebacterium diphtheriae bv. mitis]
MKEHLHPSLVRLYGGASGDDAFLYLDESYSVPDEYESGSFYILAAVKLSYGDLEGTRKTLRDISEKDYWHTTDELRTSEGQYRTVEMLKQLDSWGDKHLVSVEIPLQSGGALEQARGDCLRSLVEHIYGSARDNPPAGLIFEKRLRRVDDNRDRRLVRRLRQEGIFPREVGVAWVSPSDEQLLWAPDITCMAYRRQITHKGRNETGDYFETYLEPHSTIIYAAPQKK